MSETDNIRCVICKKTELDQTKIITCLYCFSASHYSCRNIYTYQIARVRENPFFCTTQCSEIYSRIINMQQNQKSIVTELGQQLSTQLNSVVTDAVAKQISGTKGEIIAEVKGITAAVEASQNFLSDKFDSFESNLSDLKTENERLKLELNQLKKAHSSLANTVNSLEANVDKTDKKAVSNNAIVFGLPSQPGENVPELIKKTFEQIGAGVQQGSILSATRLYESHSKNNNNIVPIRVTFNNQTAKDLIFTKKRDYGVLQSSTIHSSLLSNGNPSNVVFRDEMTPLALELFKTMQQVQKELNIKYVWGGRGGVILVKKDENAKIEKVVNRNDISRIQTLYSETVSSDMSSSSSPEIIHNNKRRKNQQKNSHSLQKRLDSVTYSKLFFIPNIFFR